MNCTSPLVAIALSLIAHSVPAFAEAPRNAWPQSTVDVPADPAVLYGQMPNGLRYAIMHHETPKGAISIRFRIGSGSIVESSDAHGVAHFLEHMSFRGSANFADGELEKALQRLGLAFGADANAFTSDVDTVYTFDLAKNDAASLTTGLKIFRDIGSKLTLDQTAVDSERGVVLSEERLRDTPDARSYNAERRFIIAGQPAATHEPIGTIASVQGMTRAQLLAYYKANYQPQNATLLIVGDVDSKAAEALVRSLFADWQQTATVPELPHGQVAQRELTVQTHNGAGINDRIDLSWIYAPDLRPVTQAVERQWAVKNLALDVLNTRLSDLGQAPDSPVLNASVAYENRFDEAGLTTIAIKPAPGKWQAALAEVVKLVRSTTEFGITADELALAKTISHRDAQAYLEGYRTRASADIAQDMLNLIGSGTVYSSPEFDLQIGNAAAQTLKLDEANALLKKLLVGQGPVVFRATPKAGFDDTAKLKAEVQQLLAEPAKPIPVEAVGEWPYSNFGKLGQVTKTMHDAALDATFVEFANGTRLAIKPTKFSVQHVSVTVSFGGGLLSVPAADARKLWRMDHLIEGGTGKLTWTQIQKSTADDDVTLEASARPLSFQLSGDGRTEDLKRQLELLAAYYVDPAFRNNDFAGQLAQYKASIEADQSNPQAIFDREAGYLETNQSPYWKPVRELSELDPAKPGDLAELLKPQMTGPVDVTIVGDVTIDDAIARVSATFGALPSAPRISPADPHPYLPVTPGRPEPYVFHHEGRKDQGKIAVIWGTDWYFGLGKDTYALIIASHILSDRLSHITREKLGIAYSAGCDFNPSLLFKGGGMFRLQADVPKDKFEIAKQLMLDQVHAVATEGVDADEFKRAQSPIVEGHRHALETNDLWQGWLQMLHADPGSRPVIDNYLSGYQGVTADDVKRVMARYVDGRLPLVVEVE